VEEGMKRQESETLIDFEFYGDYFALLSVPKTKGRVLPYYTLQQPQDL